MNINRYYIIRMQKNLFGETTITTSYGRIGSKGQLKHYYFADTKTGERLLQTTLKKRFNSQKRIGVNYAVV